MRLREHVTDLLAGPDIPVRHALGGHGLFPFRLQAFSLTDALHDRKRQGALHPFVDQVDHDIITGTDRRGNGGLARLHQFLGVAQPHVGPVGQTGDPDQVREGLWLCILHHLDNEVRPELRDAETPQFTAADVLRLDPQHIRPVEEFDHLFVIQGNLRCHKRMLRIILIVHGVGCNIILQRTDHGRVIVSENIQLQKVVIDGVIVKMGRDDAALHIVRRMLNRRKFINIMAVGEHNDAARMLSGTAPDPGTSFRDPLDLAAALALFPLLVIVLYKTVSRLVGQRTDGPGLECMPFPEKHFRIFMGLGLIVPGEVQVDIRLLVSLESEECLEGDVKSGFHQRLAAYRAGLVRHIITAASRIGSHFIRIKIAVMAFTAVVMRT